MHWTMTVAEVKEALSKLKDNATVGVLREGDKVVDKIKEIRTCNAGDVVLIILKD